MSDATRILLQIESGDPSAAEELLPLVYDELWKLAAAKLAQEKPGQTLQATALQNSRELCYDGQTSLKQRLVSSKAIHVADCLVRLSPRNALRKRVGLLRPRRGGAIVGPSS
jgi:hypothetical protein